MAQKAKAPKTGVYSESFEELKGQGGAGDGGKRKWFETNKDSDLVVVNYHEEDMDSAGHLFIRRESLDSESRKRLKNVHANGARAKKDLQWLYATYTEGEQPKKDSVFLKCSEMVEPIQGNMKEMFEVCIEPE